MSIVQCIEMYFFFLSLWPITDTLTRFTQLKGSLGDVLQDKKNNQFESDKFSVKSTVY